MKRRGGSCVLGVGATACSQEWVGSGLRERFDSAYESDDAGRLHAEARGCFKRCHLFLMPSLGSCMQRLGCPDLSALLLPNQPHDQVDEAGHEYVGK